MLTNELENALNNQMNYEIYSAHIYLAMAGSCADMGLDGFQNWMMIQYQEELFHAKKIFNFINNKGGRINITGFKDPINKYGSILEIMQKSLAHEQSVTKRMYQMMDLAKEQREHSTVSFLQWFIDEQVEEEDNVSNIISKIKLVKDAGLYLLDQDLGKRIFTEPTA